MQEVRDWLWSRPFLISITFAVLSAEKKTVQVCLNFSLKMMSQQPGRGALGALRLYFWRFIAFISLLLLYGISLGYFHFIYYTQV